jgi:adenylosuccinate synthase
VKKEVPYPKLVIDRRAPVTTPWDRAWNQIVEKGAQHGSCGVGIRSTWEREEMGYHLWAEDLYYPEVLSRKLHILSETCPHYAGVRSKNLHVEIERFLHSCLVLFGTPGIELGESAFIFENFPHLPHPGAEMIYEGAQGLMLDSQFGFFPHVTPSRTGTYNLLAMRKFEFEPWIVTRAYATRHGNGPFVPFEGELSLKENPWESNFDGGMQGKFRTGPLSLDYLRYAVNKDHFLACHLDNATLVITCTDLLDRDYVVSDQGRIVRYQDAHDLYASIARAVGVKRVLLSDSAVSDDDLIEFVDNR